MSEPARLWVDSAGVRIAVLRWDDESNKPPALLSHGTSFCGEIWNDVAADLASRYTVYAFDRRGHGLSDKPGADQYHFEDYANDVCAIIDQLGLTNIFGIGHSAGATDLLLAAKLRPGVFSRLFVMEPTVMDPDDDRSGDTQLSARGIASVEGVLRRQAIFDSAEAAFQRFRHAKSFTQWTDEALRTYIRYGFAPLPDGRVQLRCEPAIESAMLLPIFKVTEQIYTGDGRGNPFGWFREITCPVRITTSDQSWSIYRQMAARASKLIPHASRHVFEGADHCVAQELPDQVLKAIEDFERS